MSRNEAQKPLHAHLYDFLDARSKNPVEGVFSVPLIQNELDQLRARYRAEVLPLPGFGNLEQILPDTW